MNQPLNPEGPRAYDRLQKLSDRHKAIALLEVRGKSTKQIEQELEMSLPNIFKVKADPLYKAYKMELDREMRDALSGDVEQYVQNLGMATVKRMHEHMDSEDAKISLQATKEFLDRQLPKITRSETRVATVVQIESDTVNRLLTAMQETAGIAAAEVTELEPEEKLKLIEERIFNAHLSSKDIQEEQDGETPAG